MQLLKVKAVMFLPQITIHKPISFPDSEKSTSYFCELKNKPRHSDSRFKEFQFEVMYRMKLQKVMIKKLRKKDCHRGKFEVKKEV